MESPEKRRESAERLWRRIRLRDLETLLAVAQAGGMRRAAEALHLSQGAVSKAISELEDTVGARLFDRNRRGVEPTVYGQALLRRGRVILDELRHGANEIQSLADPDAGELRIGVGESLAASLVPAVVERLHRRHPRLTVKIESGDPPVLLDHFLRQRICEVVILRPWSSLSDPDLQIEPLFYERLSIVVGRLSPWAQRRKVALEDLLDELWVLSHAEVLPGSPVNTALEARGLTLPGRLTLSGSLNVRYSLLATGRYVTVMPMTVLKLCAGRGAVKPLPIKLPRWALPTVVATLKRRELSAVASRFVERTREVSAKLG